MNLGEALWIKLAKRLSEEISPGGIAYGLFGAPVASILGTNLTSGVFQGAALGTKDSITDKDIEAVRKKVNELRISKGRTPVDIHSDFSKTPLMQSPLVSDADKQVSRTAFSGQPGIYLEPARRGAFNPFVYADPKSPFSNKGSILAHELGHATPSRLLKLRLLLQLDRRVPGLLALGIGSMGYDQGKGGAGGDLYKKIQMGTTAAGALGTGAIIAEETRATLKAKQMLKALGKTPQGLKRLLMTYAVGMPVGGLAAWGGGVGLGKLMKHHEKKSEEQTTLGEAPWIKQAEITLDINKGDTLLGGKYKNSPITVEDIGTDELGQPTVNGRKLLAYRIKKKMPEKTAASDRAKLKTILGLCLQRSLEDIEKDPSRKLLMGPAGRKGDSAHFWTEGATGRSDRASEAVGKGYAYKGRVVDPAAVKAEIQEKTAMRIFSLQTANQLRPALAKLLKNDPSKIQALRNPMSMVTRKVEVLPGSRGPRTLLVNGEDYRQPFSTAGMQRMKQILLERAKLARKPPKGIPSGRGTAAFVHGD